MIAPLMMAEVERLDASLGWAKKEMDRFKRAKSMEIENLQRALVLRRKGSALQNGEGKVRQPITHARSPTPPPLPRHPLAGNGKASFSPLPVPPAHRRGHARLRSRSHSRNRLDTESEGNNDKQEIVGSVAPQSSTSENLRESLNHLMVLLGIQEVAYRSASLRDSRFQLVSRWRQHLLSLQNKDNSVVEQIRLCKTKSHTDLPFNVGDLGWLASGKSISYAKLNEVIADLSAEKLPLATYEPGTMSSSLRKSLSEPRVSVFVSSNESVTHFNRDSASLPDGSEDDSDDDFTAGVSSDSVAWRDETFH